MATKKKTAKKKAAKKKATKKGAKRVSKKTSKRSSKKKRGRAAASSQQTIVRPPATLPPVGQRQWAAVYSNAKQRFMQAGVSEAQAKNAAARQAWCVVKRYYDKGPGGRWQLRRKAIPMGKYPPGCGPAVAANPGMIPVVGDRVRFVAGPKGQTGMVENKIRSTYWVRMDADKSLVATHAQNVELLESGPGHAKKRAARNNPSEEVVNAAYRYVSTLDNLQGAMQMGNRKQVREARKLVDLAEKNLMDAVGAPSVVGASLAAAVGGGLGALAGPGWAALGSGIGSWVGSTLGGISEEEEEQIPTAVEGRLAGGPVFMGGAVGERPQMVPEQAVEGEFLQGEASGGASSRPQARPIAHAQPARRRRGLGAQQPGGRRRRRSVEAEEAETTPIGAKRPPQPPGRKKRGPHPVPTPESTPGFDLEVVEGSDDFMEGLDEFAVGNPGKIRRLKNSLLK